MFEHEPNVSESFVPSLVKRAEVDPKPLADLLAAKGPHAWSAEHQSATNVPFVRPAHDRWGVGKIMFIHCDDFLQVAFARLAPWTNAQPTLAPCHHPHRHHRHHRRRYRRRRRRRRIATTADDHSASFTFRGGTWTPSGVPCSRPTGRRSGCRPTALCVASWPNYLPVSQSPSTMTRAYG